MERDHRQSRLLSTWRCSNTQLIHVICTHCQEKKKRSGFIKASGAWKKFSKYLKSDSVCQATLESLMGLIWSTGLSLPRSAVDQLTDQIELEFIWLYYTVFYTSVLVLSILFSSMLRYFIRVDSPLFYFALFYTIVLYFILFYNIFSNYSTLHSSLFTLFSVAV